MREILFRGKRENDDVWVYGIPYENYIIREICWDNEFPEALLYPVHFGTIGQFTGLTDKNGTKIFEGDIVKLHYFFDNHDSQTLGYFEDEDEIVAEIRTDSLGVLFISDGESGHLCNYLQEPSEELEVIGNIHDNPELLEEKI